MHSNNFNNYGDYKQKCSCINLYIGKTDRSFRISYNEHVSEIKSKKSSTKFNFGDINVTQSNYFVI